MTYSLGPPVSYGLKNGNNMKNFAMFLNIGKIVGMSGDLIAKLNYQVLCIQLKDD